MKKKTKRQEMTIHLWTHDGKSSVIVETFPIDSKGHYIDVDDDIVDEFPLSWKLYGSELHFFLNGKLCGPIFKISGDDTYLEQAIALTDQLRSVLCEFAFELKTEMNWLTPVTHTVVTDVDIETNGWKDHLISIVKMILADIHKDG